MKPDDLEGGIVGFLNSGSSYQDGKVSVRRDNIEYFSVGFRLCPCKTGNAHYHGHQELFCDVPNDLFACLPRGMSCNGEGLCCFKTEIPGLFGRIVSRDEANFALRRAQLIRNAAHAMGACHNALNERYRKAGFSRKIIMG